MKGVTAIIFFVSLIAISLIFVSAYDGEMTVEANFVGFGEEVVSIQVPDYIYLGEVSKDNPIAESNRLYVYNNGSIDMTVTPQLAANSPEVFNYTYFRKYTSSGNQTLNLFHRIGEYTMHVNKNGGKEQFYVSLNLTDFNGTLSSNNLNLSTTIKFVAMAAE